MTQGGLTRVLKSIEDTEQWSGNLYKWVCKETTRSSM